MIYNSFLWVLDRSMAAVIVIVAVLLARVLLRRAPKKYSYMLWGIVALRLIVPVDIASPVSIYNLVNTPQAYTRDRIAAALEIADGNSKEKISGQTDVGASNGTGNPVQNGSSRKNQLRQVASRDALGDGNTGSGNNTIRQTGNANRLSALLTKGSYVWLSGMVLLFSWNMVLLYRMKRRLRFGVRLRDNVYECDNIPTPFVFGWMRPRIYIPFRLSEEEQSYIIAHERYHIKRKDYAIKVFAFLLCTIYWFHPLVWLAYALMNRDMEMSCDEHVLIHCEDDIRKDYSSSLLSFAVNRRMWGAGMLAFGESAVKKRVTHVMKFQKAKKWMAFAAAAVVIVAGICCLTGREKEKSSTEKVVNQLASSEDSYAILGEAQVGDRELALLYLRAEGEELRPENGYYRANAQDLETGKTKFSLVCSKDGDLLGQLELSGNMLGQNGIAFPEDGITLALFDCDGDGRDNDFALGQKIAADDENTMCYGFFGVDENGGIYRYAVPESEDSAVIQTAAGEYSQPFVRKDGAILYESPEGKESSAGICRKQPIAERKNIGSAAAIYDKVKRTMPKKVTEELEKSGWITMRYLEEGLVTYSFGNDEWEPDLRLDFTFDLQGNLLQYENKEYGFTEQMREGAHKDILITKYIRAFAKAFVRENLTLSEKKEANTVWEVTGTGRYEEDYYYNCYEDYDGFYVTDSITGMVTNYEKEVLPAGGSEVVLPHELSLADSTGVDGAQIYYADAAQLIVGGSFGVFRYDWSEKYQVDTCYTNLEFIGCQYTQGENYCEVNVSKDGRYVYLHPKDGDSAYRLDMSANRNVVKIPAESMPEEEEFYEGSDFISASYVDKSGERVVVTLTDSHGRIGEIGCKIESETKGGAGPYISHLFDEWASNLSFGKVSFRLPGKFTVDQLMEMKNWPYEDQMFESYEYTEALTGKSQVFYLRKSVSKKMLSDGLKDMGKVEKEVGEPKEWTSVRSYLDEKGRQYTGWLFSAEGTWFLSLVPSECETADGLLASRIIRDSVKKDGDL